MKRPEPRRAPTPTSGPARPDAAFARLAAHPEAWTGGRYEVRLDLPRGGVAARRARLRRLWAHPSLGPPHVPEGVPSAAVWRPLDLCRTGAPSWLYGRARLADGREALASSHVQTIGDTAHLSFGLSLGSLAVHAGLPVGAFPFDDGRPLAWRLPLDAWLADLARWVHAAHPADLALVGWTDGHEDVTAASVRAGGVPAVRWVGMLVPAADGTLELHGPTEGGPLSVG